MHLFKDGLHRKVDFKTFKNDLGIDLEKHPYTLENLKESFRTYPRQYFSGWQNSEHSQMVEYETKKNQLASTNYIAHLNSTASQHARNSAALLTEKWGFPMRTWMASFLTRPYFDRPRHYDWYDGILFNFSGQKVVTMYLANPLHPTPIYRYIFDESKMEPPTSAPDRIVLNAGEALHIPAFAHHYVENTGEEETAAVSFAFDPSILLIEVFKHTLEYCTGELRTPYQARSMGGPRLYGSKENWAHWKKTLENRNGDLTLTQQIREELCQEVPQARARLTEDAHAFEMLREEWRIFAASPARGAPLDIDRYFNP